MRKRVYLFATISIFYLASEALGAQPTRVYEERDTFRGRAAPKIETRLDGSVIQGFENNVNLDSSRQSDNFTQSNVAVTLKYPVLEKLKAKVGCDFMDVAYWEYTDYSLMDAIFQGGLESRLTKSLTLDSYYNFELLHYPDNDHFDYLAHIAGAKIRQDIRKGFYFGAGYEFMYKDYSDLKANLGAGYTSNNSRRDYRHTIRQELGVNLLNALVKLKDEYYHNNSNDQYMDYYDYGSYKLSLSVYAPIIRKLSGIIGTGHQWRWYDSRRITDGGSLERDRTFLTNAGLVYEIKPWLSLMGNYAYRQNYSNDPIQTYSESVITGGAFFAF